MRKRRIRVWLRKRGGEGMNESKAQGRGSLKADARLPRRWRRRDEGRKGKYEGKRMAERDKSAERSGRGEEGKGGKQETRVLSVRAREGDGGIGCVFKAELEAGS